jgi:hypothetical protein
MIVSCTVIVRMDDGFHLLLQLQVLVEAHHDVAMLMMYVARVCSEQVKDMFSVFVQLWRVILERSDAMTSVLVILHVGHGRIAVTAYALDLRASGIVLSIAVALQLLMFHLRMRDC